jgi:NAD(P)-dependent dehydrogenase (short-subunit alcohol dehydrogenase family)
VTGGSRGIGLAICRHLLGEGATVAAGYSRDEASARALRDANPDRVSIHQGNIGVVEDCNRVVSEVIDHYGKVDILVNNAGITADHTVRKMGAEEWDRVVRINLNGAFYLSRAVLDPMIEHTYGRIVNISSVIGETGKIGQANYSAAKSGLFGLTKTLARETARRGITVNCVAPGFIATEMVSAMPEDALAKVVAQIPIGRLGAPEEVARVVAFLVDPAAAYITGSIVDVNGGLNM